MITEEIHVPEDTNEKWQAGYWHSFARYVAGMKNQYLMAEDALVCGHEIVSNVDWNHIGASSMVREKTVITKGHFGG